MINKINSIPVTNKESWRKYIIGTGILAFGKNECFWIEEKYTIHHFKHYVNLEGISIKWEGNPFDLSFVNDNFRLYHGE